MHFGLVQEYYDSGVKPNLTVKLLLTIDDKLPEEHLSAFSIRVTQNANRIMKQEKLLADAGNFTAYLVSSIGKKLRVDIKSQEERFNLARSTNDFVDMLALIKEKYQPRADDTACLYYENLNMRQADAPFNGSWPSYYDHVKRNKNALDSMKQLVPDYVLNSLLKKNCDQNMFQWVLNSIKLLEQEMLF
jgi:hypothetical protein